MSSGATGLAGRYASALYALAVDSSKVVSIHAELGSLETMLVENQDLKKLVESPILSRGEQQAAIIAIMKKSGADALIIKFSYPDCLPFGHGYDSYHPSQTVGRASVRLTVHTKNQIFSG